MAIDVPWVALITYRSEGETMEWLSSEDPIVKPEDFAPEDLGLVKLGMIVFVERVYQWMKAATPDIILEKEESIIGAKRMFATEGGLAVFHSCFDAPATVALAEALIAAGIEQLVVFGEAGSIDPSVNPGELLIPTFAVREEGVSYHYLPSDIKAVPSPRLLNKLKSLLDRTLMPCRDGGVWTTDALFRETMGKVSAHAKAGVLAVEMECSAVFSLAMYRRTQTAALLLITDTLYEGKWSPAFNKPEVADMEKRVSEILVTHWHELV